MEPPLHSSLSLIHLCWRNKLWIATSKLVGFLIAVAFLWLGPRYYEATAFLEMPMVKASAESGGNSEETVLRTHEARLRFPALHEKLLAPDGGSLNPSTLEAFQRALTVSVVRRTRLLGITVRDASPEVARSRASGLATLYLSELARVEQKELAFQRDQWKANTARMLLAWQEAEKSALIARNAPGIPPAGTAEAGRTTQELATAARNAGAAYEASLRQLREAETRLQVAPVPWRIEPPLLPYRPAWPLPWLTLLTGLILGGIGGTWLVWLRKGKVE